jgi:pSer/pThr/pTyr-binding forkhead associated (FHA) protein
MPLTDRILERLNRMRRPVQRRNPAREPPQGDAIIMPASAVTSDEAAHGDHDASAYTVLLESHWCEPQAPAPATIDGAAPASPLAGEAALRLQVEDQGGVREVVLPEVLPGRRYSIGKDRSSDIVVEGTYASRRHCELWLHQGRWWIDDLGSTNGSRIELGGRVLAVSGGRRASSESRSASVEVVAGADIVLSADAHGPVSDYPRVSLDRDSTAADLATPRAPCGVSEQAPRPSIARPAAGASRYIVEATTADGVRALTLEKTRLPWSVGRSRRSALIVPRIHEGVSGHHIDIVALDEEGAEVLVHGANGVRRVKTAYGAGERFHWRVGEVLEFGRASAQEPALTLRLFQDAFSGTVRE